MSLQVMMSLRRKPPHAIILYLDVWGARTTNRVKSKFTFECSFPQGPDVCHWYGVTDLISRSLVPLFGDSQAITCWSNKMKTVNVWIVFLPSVRWKWGDCETGDGEREPAQHEAPTAGKHPEPVSGKRTYRHDDLDSFYPGNHVCSWTCWTTPQCERNKWRKTKGKKLKCTDQDCVVDIHI